MKKDVWKNNIKELRLKRNLTQQQVALMLGHKSNDQVSHWEKGVFMPSVKNLHKLSDIFEVQIDNIFF